MRRLASTAESDVGGGLQERLGTDEAGVILATMKRLPEDLLSYVMAYTPVRESWPPVPVLASWEVCLRVSGRANDVL